jgi:hypothetical protein
MEPLDQLDGTPRQVAHRFALDSVAQAGSISLKQLSDLISIQGQHARERSRPQRNRLRGPAKQDGALPEPVAGSEHCDSSTLAVDLPGLIQLTMKHETEAFTDHSRIQVLAGRKLHLNALAEQLALRRRERASKRGTPG